MNPWLTIPLDEYEAHMALPVVDQAALMADILASICETYRPPSLALLGCAGGLGLDRVNPAVVSRIVAIDINGVYAERARERYARRFHAKKTDSETQKHGGLWFFSLHCLYGQHSNRSPCL